jgi:hypothetical protein
MKRFEVGRNSPPFKSFTAWLAGEVPEARDWIAKIDALVITRNLLGDTVRLVTPAPTPSSWARIAASIAEGLESQCGLRPFDVECSPTL